MSAIIVVFINVLNLLWYLLIARILLSWFPNINWHSGVFKLLDSVTEPILTPFRRIIPPIGGMLDISPIVPLVIIQAIIGALQGSSSSF